MNSELIQKRLFRKQEFHLAEGEIRIRRSVGGQVTEWSIPFEELGNRTFVKRGSHLPFIITSIIEVTILVFLAFYYFTDNPGIRDILAAAAIWAIFPPIMYLGRDRSIFLVGGTKNIEYYLETPSEQVVKDFLNFVIASANSYLKNKYGTIDVDLPIDPQIGRLLWLRDRNILTDSEFQVAKEALTKNAGLKNSSIGFTST